MMSRLTLTALLCLGIIWTSCRKDFEYEPSNGQLQFSRDTVFLDTVFTGISSSTYSLKVYNPTASDLRIPYVGLGRGAASGYRLNVDGDAGKEFRDIPILAGDSLYVFIETTLDISSLNQDQFLYTDSILFGAGSNTQAVALVTLVRDAVFLYPATLANGRRENIPIGSNPDGSEILLQGFYLDDGELDFTNEKPYVIYGYAALAEGQTLRMAPGTRVYFHKNSGIWAGPGGAVQINGAPSNDPDMQENEVIMEGDRLEPEFSDTPGQWGALWLSEGSVDNSITHLTLKNATVGIYVEGNPQANPPVLRIANTRIFNSSLVNLWGRNTSIYGENLVLGNAGNACFYGNLGGNYEFLHCTFANYWSDGFRTGSAVQLNNYEAPDNGLPRSADLTGAYFGNCVVAGNTRTELFLDTNGSNLFDFEFDHCLIKYEGTPVDSLYDFQNILRYLGSIRNGDPAFLDVVKQDFRITSESAAVGNGSTDVAIRVPFDLLGTDRSLNPDLGAYQHQQ